MVKTALTYADNRYNVYIEARTIAETAPRGKGRGDIEDTHLVLALVVDADADKDKGGVVTAEPTLVVKTSPGKAHRWFFFDRALTVAEAKAIGEAIRAATGTDNDTGVITQPTGLQEHRTTRTPRSKHAGG